MVNTFCRLLGHLRQQQTTKDTYRQITRPVIVQPTSHKATTIRALTRRATLVCDSSDSLQDETDYLNNVFSKNNYSADFVRRNSHSDADSNTQTNVNFGHVTTATIPYIRGTSETIARILRPYNMRVARKPTTTLRRLLTSVKDKDKPEDRQGAVYKIKCCDCQATYIGEAGRNLNTPQGKVTSTITLLSTIYRRNIKSTGILRHVLRIPQTTINDSL